MLDQTTLPAAVTVTSDDLLALSERSARMLQKIRDSMLQPHPRKQSPIFPSNKVQYICGIDRTRMSGLLKQGKLPQGQQDAPNKMRKFTLAETIEWVKATRKPPIRPEGALGKVITIGNFKGGVTKTTTSMMLAQGLALRRGRKVLLIDLDPQGSTTTLFGINPHAEISAEQTVLPVIEGEAADLMGAPMETYWENLDLIPSSTDLFNAEFLLPAKVHGGDPNFQFWEVLLKAVAPLRKKYDYIILDTAPTLSYLTINALFAADSIIVPVVPDTLSFASMVQFWSLFSDLVGGIKNYDGNEAKKTFDYVDILITRLPNKPPAMVVRDWIIKTYGDHVLPVEIPETTLAMSTSTEFSTVYDLPNWEGSAEAYRRICDPYDRLVDIIDHKTSQLWGKSKGDVHV
jgi:chromosome partitioning protein